MPIFNVTIKLFVIPHFVKKNLVWTFPGTHRLQSRRFHVPISKNLLYEATYSAEVWSFIRYHQNWKFKSMKNWVKTTLLIVLISISELWLRYHNFERFLNCLGQTELLLRSCQRFHGSQDVARFLQDLAMVAKMLVRGSTRKSTLQDLAKILLG